MLERIDKAIKYVNIPDNLINLAISKESTDFTEELLKTSHTNLNNIVDVILKAVTDPSKCLVEGNENILVSNHGVIKNWVPDSIQYAAPDRLPKHKPNEWFLNIAQNAAIEKVLKAFQGKNDLTTAKEAFLQVLEVFEEFICNNVRIKEQVQEYAHVFKQQLEYIKFLSQVCEKPVDYAHMLDSIQQANTIIANSLATQIKAIKLNSNGYQSYYNKAIELLTLYPQELSCTKTMAEAYMYIGKLKETINLKIALAYYGKAVKLDPELYGVYDKIGEILLQDKKYTDAIKCFKVGNNTIKIEECIKKYIESKPDDVSVRQGAGEYFVSTGRVEKAIKCYQQAASLTSNLEEKKVVAARIADLFTKQNEIWANMAKQWNDQANGGDFYNLQAVDPAELSQLVGEVDNMATTG